jgi:iron(III) transport system substrate-binding protein
VRRLLIALAALLAACGGGQPAAAPASPAAAGRQNAGWDRLLAAAKQEGKVSVIAPAGNATRAAIVDPFQQKYGIEVDALSVSGSSVTARVMSERAAGKYLWDVFVNGVTDVLTTFIPANAVDPLEPALVLPEVTNLNNWRGGTLEFLDQGHTLLVTTRTVYPTVWVNPNLFKPEQLKSYQDLLDPSFKGKLVMDDPRKSGPGQALLALWYLSPNLGADFIRAIARQQPLLMSDYQQEANAVGQGKYPILLGGSDQTLTPLTKEGLPIAVVPPQQLKEPVQVAAGATGLALFNRAPHPDAAKVYINWLLSKEGQALFARSQSAVSARVDVPADYLELWRVPGSNAIKTYGPEVLAVRDKVQALAKEAFQ